MNDTLLRLLGSLPFLLATILSLFFSITIRKDSPLRHQIHGFTFLSVCGGFPGAICGFNLIGQIAQRGLPETVVVYTCLLIGLSGPPIFFGFDLYRLDAKLQTIEPVSDEEGIRKLYNKTIGRIVAAYAVLDSGIRIPVKPDEKPGSIVRVRKWAKDGDVLYHERVDGYQG